MSNESKRTWLRDVYSTGYMASLKKHDKNIVSLSQLLLICTIWVDGIFGEKYRSLKEIN